MHGNRSPNRRGGANARIAARVNLAALEFASLCAVATFAAGISLRSPSIRPHAIAAASCAGLYVARILGGPRVAVVVYVLWPGAAVALAWWTLKDEGPGGCPSSPARLVAVADRLRSAPPWSSSGPGTVSCEVARGSGSAVPVRGSVQILALAVLAVYAFALARWGAILAPWWPWPILAPNALPALALWLCRRPRTWAERAAYVLPASALADVATTWSGAPGDARAIIGIVTWATFGGMIAACLTDRRARGRC